MQKTMRKWLTIAAALLLVVGGTGCSAKAKKAWHMSRANHYYGANQLDRAEIEYLNVLRYDPANSVAYNRLGQIYYNEGRLMRALFFLSKGSQLAPDDLDVRLKLGFIYSSAGMATSALAQANFVLQKKPLDDEAPLLLAETASQPKDIAAIRQRLQTMVASQDRASVETALGNLALRERDVAAAGAALKKAQALNPKLPAVNAALGAVSWAQGDLKQAETYYKAAADASPPNSPRRMQYVRFKLQTGDVGGAHAALAEIQKEAPGYVPATMLLAEIAASENKFDDADAFLEKVLNLDPDNFDALMFQGQMALKQEDGPKAVNVMERMARVYPQAPRVHFQLGEAYFMANDLTKAANSLDHALELNPNFPEAIMTQAQLQLKMDNPGSAIISLEQLTKKAPQLLQAQLLLADAYRKDDKVNNALAIYQQMEKLYPTNAQIALLHGSALVQAKDRVEARKYFERVLALAPSHLTAIEQLVDLDLAEQKFDAGLQLVGGELQKNPKWMEMHMLTAKIYLAQGKGAEAEKVLLQVNEMDPDRQSAYLLLAQLYMEQGQNAKAKAKLDVAMAKNPRDPAALMLAASIYTANKDYQGAADAYESLLKVNPKNSPALNNLAYIYSEQLNNLDRALELAKHARELLPFNASAADTLGWISFKKGAYQSALELLQQSAAKIKGEPEVQYHLGMANYMLDNEAEARAALQKAQESTNFSGRAECQRCLAILDIKPETADANVKSLLEKRVAEKSDDPVALVRLARIYQREGNVDKAIASYEALVQAMPKNLDATVALTQLYAVKDPQKAYEMAKAANKLAPYNPEVSHTLGQLAFHFGDYQLAFSVLQQMLQSQPNDAMLRFDYAQAAYSVGKVPEAQAALQNALELNLPAAQATQARRTLEMITLAASPTQAAAGVARINEILKSEPNDVPALVARVAACESTSDTAGAEQAGEKVLEHYPDFAPVQRQLAWLYAPDSTKQDRAYALAMKARDDYPDDPVLAKIIGVILVKRADYSHAVTLLKQSAAKTATDAEVFYYLGSAQFQLKNRTESKANLQQALALKLTDPLAASAKQMLNELK